MSRPRRHCDAHQTDVLEGFASGVAFVAAILSRFTKLVSSSGRSLPRAHHIIRPVIKPVKWPRPVIQNSPMACLDCIIRTTLRYHNLVSLQSKYLITLCCYWFLARDLILLDGIWDNLGFSIKIFAFRSNSSKASLGCRSVFDEN